MRPIKHVALALALLAITASTATAQSDKRPRPFTKDVVSQKQLVDAIEKCDKDVLNVSCDKLVDAANTVFKLDIETDDAGDARKELASYVGGLAEKPCPQGKETTLARVMPDGKIDLNGFSRAMQVGERCLFDNQLAKWVLSLTCGNFITGELPLIFTNDNASAEKPTAAVPQPPPGPSREDLDAAARRALLASEEAEAAKRRAERMKEEFERSERRAQEARERARKAERAENGDRSFLERHWKKAAIAAVATGVVWCALECRLIKVNNTNIQNNGVRR